LLNRGWVSRKDITNLKTPSLNKQTIVANWQAFPKKAFTLKDIPEPNTWPKVVDTLGAQNIQTALGNKFYPALFLLEDKADDGLKRQWVFSVMPPEKHQGYAVQWFGYLKKVSLDLLYLFLIPTLC